MSYLALLWLAYNFRRRPLARRCCFMFTGKVYSHSAQRQPQTAALYKVEGSPEERPFDSTFCPPRKRVTRVCIGSSRFAPFLLLKSIGWCLSPRTTRGTHALESYARLPQDTVLFDTVVSIRSATHISSVYARSGAATDDNTPSAVRKGRLGPSSSADNEPALLTFLWASHT